MTGYVAFLRGINVGRNKAVSMDALRELLTGLGYGDVRTHLRSGNAVFTTPGRPATVERAIEQAIADQWGMAVKVLVRTGAELDAVIAANTLPTTDGAKLQVCFLDRAPAAASLRDLDPATFAPEQFQIGRRELYLWCPEGVTASALVKTITEKRIDRVITARNWNTVIKLASMMD
jgi:uncharacterized protein (DUF1697 family)